MLKTNKKNIWRWKNSVFLSFFPWLELAQNGALIKGHQSLFQVPKKAEQNMTKNNYRITEKNFKKNRIC